MSKFEPKNYPEKKQQEVVLEHGRRAKRYLRTFINDNIRDVVETRDLERAQALLKSKRYAGESA
jgi:hypothetical protein